GCRPRRSRFGRWARAASRREVILLRRRVVGQAHGLEGVRPVTVDLDPHDPTVADRDLVGDATLDRGAARLPRRGGVHEDENALLVNVEEALGLEVNGGAPRTAVAEPSHRLGAA